MATRALKRIKSEWDGRVMLYQWTGLTKATDDVGEPLVLPQYSDKTIHVTGTGGVGGVVTIEGSNELDSANWATLDDPQGNALAMAVDKIEAVLENTYRIRPRVTAGDGTTNLTVTVLVT